MQSSQLLLVVLAVASALAVAQAYKKSIWGTAEERSAIMEEAITEAKLGSQLRDETEQALKNKPITFQSVINRGFKKPSVIAQKQGKARLMMEDMVHRAERKLQDMRRKQMAATASDTEMARMLADELYHHPGSLLTEDEIAKMFIESDCEDERKLEVSCDSIPTLNLYRQIDGTCNNIEKPLQGASDTALRRLTPPAYEDGIGELRGLRQSREGVELEGLDPNNREPFNPPHPSARSISQLVIRDFTNEEPFSHLLMQFGQFLDHDLDFSPELEVECEGCELTEQCVPIRVDPNDRVFGLGTANNGNCLPFRRAIAVCDNGEQRDFAPREQINAITSYIDASMVYGSNERQAKAVREFSKGLLRVGDRTVEDDRESLPVDEEHPEIVACPGREDCFLCGEVRCNEQVSLTIMHTLWVREHNRIAKELAILNPDYDDELLYQEARKIVGAIIQKIVFYDYLPIVFGQDNFNQLIGQYRGYDTSVDASVPNVFATAAYRYGHSLIRPTFDRLNPDFQNAQPPLRLAQMFFNPPLFFQSDGVGRVARGWTDVASRRVDEFLNIVITRRLFQNNAFFGPIGMDLASLNLQRARDHGIDTYGTWKYFCQTAFPGLDLAEFNDSVTEARLRRLHRFVEFSELFTSGLAERRVPGALLGPTFLCLFAITFRDVRDGDRFYFENNGVFTEEQRAAIKATSFSRVICDNTDTTDLRTDSFRLTGNRVSCQSPLIPKLDLTPWANRECFLRIGVPTGVQIAAFSKRVGDPRFQLFTNQGTECLPVVCPGSLGSTKVLSFSTPDFTQCTPDGTTLGPFVFASVFTDADVSNTIQECQSRPTPAITFTCRPGAAAASAKDDSNNPLSSFYRGKIPDEVSKELKEEYENQLVASQEATYDKLPSAENKGRNDMKLQENEKEEEVMSELQSFLDKLD